MRPNRFPKFKSDSVYNLLTRADLIRIVQIGFKCTRRESQVFRQTVVVYFIRNSFLIVRKNKRGSAKRDLYSKRSQSKLASVCNISLFCKDFMSPVSSNPITFGKQSIIMPSPKFQLCGILSKLLSCRVYVRR